ncbi:DUF4855 domain-containing protein [Bacillus sp. OK048]|uniref:DUF4855 domain-containing protein n=1 Tax=Bacillus sp. OK048 TaxID=1882761 RepID=UPI000888C0C6|nr:DUF4855 domain-containing protein [Bacillus sp. OK048]SDM89810.1 protein of unknown function [Bacillus sp. OK048]
MKGYFKRIIFCFIAICLFLGAPMIPVRAEFLPKDDPKTNHSSNMVLIYSGYYDPANYDGEKIGDYDVEKFMPYVGYLNDKGIAEDYFFDTFLMLVTKSPYNGSLARYYSWVEGAKPGTLKDWKWAMDRVFVKNQQLDALDKAVKKVGSTLDNKDKKVNVYLTLPFPDPQSKDFGDFKGDGTSANLESLETRNELVKWYIDEMVSRFNERNYKHLNLAGFYWLQEDLDTTVPGEKENVQYASEYLNRLDLRLGWIPWSGAGEKANGNRHGFDFTLVQPNHYFQADTTIDRIKETAELSYGNNQGIEMEFDLRAIEDPHYRQALYNYLIGGVKYEYMSDSMLAYYQDVYAIHDLYHHKSPVGRQFYNDIYHFTKGEYTPPTGNLNLRVVDRDGKPLSDVTVTDENGLPIEVTDRDGRMIVNDLFSIKNTFTFTKEGYPSKTLSFDIPVDETVYGDVTLGNPKGENLLESYTVSDFQGEFNVGGNGVVGRSFSQEHTFSGKQSLKASFPNGWGPVRAFIDSDSPLLDGSDRQYTNFTNENWSDYDSISFAVYNDTEKEQVLKMEFMYNAYSWASSREKKVKIQPKQWNQVEIMLDELAADGADLTNIIRMTLKMDEFATNGATLYFDNIKLNKYETITQVPKYSISLPSKVPTMDIGSIWTPTVVNESVLDESGKPVIETNIRFESTAPDIIEVNADGQLKALKEGKAAIRAFVNGIEAESAVVEVSPWNRDVVKGGDSVLAINDEATLSLQSFFNNGYKIPWQDMKYEWSILSKKDVLTIRDSDTGENQQIVTGLKNGKATIQVKVTYNEKTRVFTKDIKVKNNP